MKKLILAMCLMPTLAFAQGDIGGTLTKVATTAAPFLKIGVGARSVALGEAFTAVADDISAMYWNPSGLSRLKGHGVTFTHAEWLADVTFDYAAVVVQMGDFGAVGAGVTALTVPDDIVRTVDKPEGTGEIFNASDLAVNVSYARNLTDRFSIGFSAKYVHQKIWHMSASTVAVDVGALFVTPFWDTRLGASISNFGGKMKLAGRDILIQDYDPFPRNTGNVERVNADYRLDSFPLPLLFRFGLSKDFLHGNANRLTLSADAIHPNDNAEYVNTGIEYALKEAVFLRVGYKSLFLNDSEEGLTTGGGLHLRMGRGARLKLDYAYADFGRLNNVQRFSVSVEF